MRIVLVAVALVAGPAAAEPAVESMPTPRQVGRAGASVVSDDGAGALLISPASLARNPARRAELGLVVHDTDARFRAAGASDGPTIEDRAGARVMPSALVAERVGDVVLAAGYVEVADHVADLPAPEPGQPAADVARLFPHRYAGTATSLSIRTAMLGAALRLSDAVALGLALHVSTVALSERRTVWAGFAGRDEPGDPARDLALALDADDALVAGGAVGVLVAPPELPVELALGGRVRGRARAGGTVGLDARHGADFPQPTLDDPAARVTLPLAFDVVAGARYLGDRIGVELAGDLAWSDEAIPTWRLTGVEVVDQSGQRAALDQVDALLTARTRWSGRGCVEVAAVDGFLWLTAGYAYARAGRSAGRLGPAAVDLASHTIALGAEAAWDDLAITLGWARALSRSRAVTDSAVPMLNPFGAAPAAAAGRYDTSGDHVGLAVRIDWR